MALISVIVPSYNEKDHIDDCLRSLSQFEVSMGDEIEILVVDGDSSDGTVSRVREWIGRDARIRLLRNPARFTPHAMNIGIAGSRGEFIARVDAHSIYPIDYLKSCLETIRRTGADNVGGVCETMARGNGYSASVVQALTTHKFGVGNSGFRTQHPEGPADTVPYGFFRRDIFDRIGRYDERLIRAQDYEFNRRIQRSGGTVWLNPAIRLAYYQQPTVGAFLRKQIALEAPYNAYLWYAAPYAFTMRHAITAAFAAGVVCGAILSPYMAVVRWIFLTVLVLYGLAAIAAAVSQARRYRRPLHIVALPLAFFSYHFLHGLGVWWGLIRVVTRTAPHFERSLA